MITLQVKKLSETAKMPIYAHEGDAGLDLFAAEAVTVNAGERVQIKTGIAVAIPQGHAGLIWDKSGLSHTIGIKVMGGVIDSGYRGEVLVGLVNLGTEPHIFAVGDKISQMLIQKVERPEIFEVALLDETTRGKAGFGSTGI